MSRMRTLVVLTALAIVGAPVAMSIATGEGDPLQGGVRNPGPAAAYDRETEIISNNSTYSTRQSNKSDNGGGAVYGCRSKAGGTAAGNEPCLRVNNLVEGSVFEFKASKGVLGGTITVGGGGDAVKPFTTNATGVAEGLNADRVDGANATDLRTRWALINEAGNIEEQSGGFTIANNNANANIYINAGSSLVGKGLEATIAIQNRVAGVDASFSGQVAIARCNTIAVACAPANTNNDNTIVVRATPSDGQPSNAQERKRFYVTVTE